MLLSRLQITSSISGQMKTTIVNEKERYVGTIKTMRVLVSGKVQGVFYRASTLQEARDLELTGWVRNLEDGRVECKAIGKETDLLTLLH